MTVVAGVDDSPVSKHVIARAIDQAHWRESSLHVVHVMHLPMVYTDAPVDWAAITESYLNAVWQPLEDVISRSDVPVERVDLEGYPPDLLVRYATENDASLLVVGTRGRGDLASLILGSTSHRAIHLAGCDVLVVKAQQEE